MNMKLFSVLLVTLLLSACGGSKKDSANQEEFVANEEVSSVTSQIAEGEALVKGSDCKTCHHAVNKIIGPAHTDVAKKYEFTAANVSMLAQKIIKGGQGVWGQIPMTAHPDITVADAEKMARYVLSLDGEQEH
ncbi:MAG: c-type cytochrome [Bacteroidota bacterium]